MLKLDVKAAFLNGELSEELYMEHPEGFIVGSKKEYVYGLNKAIHGLQQASRAWRIYLDKLLKSLDCSPSSSDAGLYLKRKNGRVETLIIVYVDDILMAGADIAELQDLAQQIGSQVEIRIEYEVTKFLRIVIEYEWQRKQSIKIHNAPIIRSTLETFNMLNCKTAATPLEMGLALTKPKKDEIGSARNVPHREVVGVLIHLSNTMRPDIAFAVSRLSRYMHEHSLQHWNSVKHLLRYLNGTIDAGISYNCNKKQTECIWYADVDFAGDKDDRKSTSRYVFMRGGGAISWRSKKQTIVAQST